MEKNDLMNGLDIAALRRWFSEYVQTFRSGDREQTQSIDLKDEHTRRVCAAILDIGRSLSLNGERLCLAEAMALLHDVGRFEQFARYRTFSDKDSEDHAMLGIRILHKHGVLRDVPRPTRNLILRVISYHNRLGLPKGETEACLFFTKLLRDADKVDIWRVVTEHYGQKEEERNGAIDLGLPHGPEISDEVCADLMAGRIVRLESLKTLNDFKVLQMAWVYDVNFPRAFQIILERRYLEMIRDALPASEKVLEIYHTVRSYVEEHAGVGE
ncbi:MAG: HD domain-containing protein [Thermodesulfobacteriota bacterium]|nr:HD domain-containing protein [Thermodesulfobacteriota bacterium]